MQVEAVFLIVEMCDCSMRCDPRTHPNLNADELDERIWDITMRKHKVDRIEFDRWDVQN